MEWDDDEAVNGKSKGGGAHLLDGQKERRLQYRSKDSISSERNSTKKKPWVWKRVRGQTQEVRRGGGCRRKKGTDNDKHAYRGEGNREIEKRSRTKRAKNKVIIKVGGPGIRDLSGVLRTYREGHDGGGERSTLKEEIGGEEEIQDQGGVRGK